MPRIEAKLVTKRTRPKNSGSNPNSLVVITNLSTLLPLPLIKWLPSTDPQSQEVKKTFPPAEVFEHHVTGSLAEPGFIPELVPELIETRD